MKTALVIGATGLVGKQLVQQLLADDRFIRVVVFVRRTTGVQHPKLQEHLIDFDAVDNWKDRIQGDVLFSTLGTTIKKAGSQDAQYKIDYTYQYNFAKAAADNGVPTYVLVSSAGATPSSRIFYSRMKGELEETVKKLPFQYIRIIQPGLLAGDREEVRMGEKIAYGITSLFKFIPGLDAYRPYQDTVVAKALINAALAEGEKVKIYTLRDIFLLAGV
jgi:uncharacterized protein YbjT (DUF2867 family)